MNIYEQYETDQKQEADKGITLDYGAAGKIRIARAGGSNQKFINLFQAKMKPYTRQVQNNTMDQKVARSIQVEVFAKTIILGWEGITDRKGEPIEFNEANAIKVMTDLPSLFDEIMVAAQDAANFRKEIVDEIVGNSPSP